MKSLVRLDGESTDSVWASLSAFSRLSSHELLTKLDEFSQSADNELSDCDRWQALADWLSVPSDSFEVCWFHGTRTANPESFFKGILPLHHRLDGIWNELAALICDKVDPSQFALLRKAVERDSYGMGRIGRDTCEARMRDPGPYAFLIKAMAVMPLSGATHHYSRVPEIVDMIFTSFPKPHRSELKQRYFQQTKSCIVKFVIVESKRRIVGCAADYLLHLRKPDSLECFLPEPFNGAGQPVPSHRIIYSKHINTEFTQR